MLLDGFTAVSVAMRVHWWSTGWTRIMIPGNSEVRWKLMPTASVQTNVCRLTTMAELVDARTRGDTVSIRSAGAYLKAQALQPNA
jgi:hypothetical protein